MSPKLTLIHWFIKENDLKLHIFVGQKYEPLGLLIYLKGKLESGASISGIISVSVGDPALFKE